MREITDWWFPLWTDESSTRIKGQKAHMTPNFAALCISRDQFNTLKRKVKYKWKTPNAFGFGVVFYRDQCHWGLITWYDPICDSSYCIILHNLKLYKTS